ATSAAHDLSTLSLHDALPIWELPMRLSLAFTLASLTLAACGGDDTGMTTPDAGGDDIGFNTPTVTLKANREVSEDNWEEIGDARSEEHTSELQSRENLVCRLL